MQLDMTKGKPVPLMLRFMLPLLLGNFSGCLCLY